MNEGEKEERKRSENGEKNAKLKLIFSIQSCVESREKIRGSKPENRRKI